MIARAQTGDRSALESLYPRHQGRLLVLIRSLMSGRLAGRIDPEDVLQETLLESSRKIAAFESRGAASFYRWLVQIARFKLAEAERAHRALKRAAPQPLEHSVPSGTTGPSGRAMRSERASSLQEALGSLPERQAQAVRLRYLEGRSIGEVASRLDCTPSAVKALVSRAMGDLAERLPQTSWS